MDRQLTPEEIAALARTVALAFESLGQACAHLAATFSTLSEALMRPADRATLAQIVGPPKAEEQPLTTGQLKTLFSSPCDGGGEVKFTGEGGFSANWP